MAASPRHFSPTIVTNSNIASPVHSITGIDSCNDTLAMNAVLPRLPIIIKDANTNVDQPQLKHRPIPSDSDDELALIAEHVKTQAIIREANHKYNTSTISGLESNGTRVTTTNGKKGRAPKTQFSSSNNISDCGKKKISDGGKKKRKGKRTSKTSESVNVLENEGDDAYKDAIEDAVITDTSAYMLDQFKFTEEEQQLNPLKEVFIQYSRVENDDLVTWHHLQHAPDKYKCLGKGCPTHKGMWRRKPAYLLLCRRNGNPRDNRLTNIEYRCPNCYFQEYGPNLFVKAKKGVDRKIRKCANDCGRILTADYKSNYCYGCKKQMEKYETGPTISQMVDITASLNHLDLDDEERQERIAMLQEIYNTDLEVEATMRRHGIAAETIAGYKRSSVKAGNNPRRANAIATDRAADPTLDTDMSGVLDNLSGTESEPDYYDPYA